MKKIIFFFACVLFSVVANAQSSYHISTARLINEVEVDPVQIIYDGDEMISFPELGVELFWSQHDKMLYVMKRLFEKTTVYQNGSERTEERSVSIVSNTYKPVDLQGAGIEYTPENLGIRKNDGVYTLKAYGQPDGLIISVILEKNGAARKIEILSREWKVR